MHRLPILSLLILAALLVAACGPQAGLPPADATDTALTTQAVDNAVNATVSAILAETQRAEATVQAGENIGTAIAATLTAVSQQTAVYETATALAIGLASPTPSPTSTATPSPTPTTSTDQGIVSPPTLPPCTIRQDWPIYTALPGDTLALVAARTGTTVEVLAQASCLPNANRIETGQQLRVPRLPTYIRLFTATDTGVNAILMATRAARVGVNWAVDYRPQGTNLVFEQVMANGTTYNVELPRAFSEVPSTGSGQVAPLLQRGDVTQLRLRLRLILNADGRTLDSREITVPIFNQPVGSNYVVSDAAQCLSAPYRPTFLGVSKRGYVVNTLAFQGLPLTNGAGFGGELLGLLPAGTAFTVVDGPFCFRPVTTTQTTWRQWRVRVDGTGQEGWVLEYDQPNNSLQTFLQAYQQTVVYEGEACYQAPFTASNGLTLDEQARVLVAQTLWNGPGPGAATTNVSIQSGETLTLLQGPYCYRDQPTGPGWRQWMVHVDSTGQEGWAFEYGSESLYMEPLSGGNPATIVSFGATPQNPTVGAGLTISWEVQGASGVTINWLHSQIQQNPQPINAGGATLPASGQQTFDPPDVPGNLTLTLSVPGLASRQIVVSIACATPWLGEGSLLAGLCPSGPAQNIQAAYQSFQTGMMIWQNNTVWVLYTASGTGKVFPDTWNGEDITYGETPPAGMFQPIRGFGRVWVDNADVRQGLGWATAEEQGFTAQFQQGTITTGGTAYLIQLPDGRRLALRQTGSDLTWQQTS